MKIVADLNKCVGAAQCLDAAPQIFDQDVDTGLVVVRDVVLDRHSKKSIEAAVNACPSGALSVVDE